MSAARVCGSEARYTHLLSCRQRLKKRYYKSSALISFCRLGLALCVRAVAHKLVAVNNNMDDGDSSVFACVRYIEISQQYEL